MTLADRIAATRDANQARGAIVTALNARARTLKDDHLRRLLENAAYELRRYHALADALMEFLLEGAPATDERLDRLTSVIIAIDATASAEHRKSTAQDAPGATNAEGAATQLPPKNDRRPAGW